MWQAAFEKQMLALLWKQSLQNLPRKLPVIWFAGSNFTSTKEGFFLVGRESRKFKTLWEEKKKNHPKLATADEIEWKEYFGPCFLSLG